jgi:hypothetical protein
VKLNCRKKPCAECPWVKETEPGQFPRMNYERLRNTTGEPGNEAPWDAPLFACHKSSEDNEMPCAGWLASVGHYSLRVRIFTSEGAIPPEAMTPGEDWPDLHETYEEMMEAKAGDSCET